MKLSEFIARLNDVLEAHGDTDHVAIGVAIAGSNGNRYRIDAMLVDGNAEVLRDTNFVSGMTCIVADHQGDFVVMEKLNAL